MPYLVSNSRGVSKISLPSVRWVVLHMIEETARHFGHSTSVPVDRITFVRWNLPSKALVRKDGDRG